MALKRAKRQCITTQEEDIRISSSCDLKWGEFVEISEQTARTLFVALGWPEYANPEKVTRRRLLVKLNALPTLITPVKLEALVLAQQRMYRKICDCLLEGPINLTAEPIPVPELAREFEMNNKATEKPPTNGSTEVVTIVTNEAMQVNSSTSSRGRDAYGCMLGKPPALINAALSRNPKTINRLARETGLDEKRVKKHLAFWVKNGTGIGRLLVDAGAEGWALKPESGVEG